MAGRSLQASAIGIERAKRALVRKSLTQKAISNELGIASWSTVSKFFNGKPVDRFLFIEICEALDLQWEDIVQAPIIDADPIHVGEDTTSETTPTVEVTDLWGDVQCQSQLARAALTPRILERIPRAVVREKYLPAIARGVEAGLPRIIPIVGPAGYGKSTILGDLYDHLADNSKSWTGLILCSSLSTELVGQTNYSLVTALEMSLGQALSGQARSLLEITRELTQHRGRGVLLIDTLDLIINRNFVPPFKLLLQRLLEVGVTVLFTCRDYEYSDYLEPTTDRLSGLAQFVDRYTVPNFSTTEIESAAGAFFHKLEPDHPERGHAFAEQILALSADNRSLQEIIGNPLLLALLCDLFAKEGNVPPDLTVSKLYRQYWQEKIAYSRFDQSDATLLAIEKESLCLTIARRLFELSGERLCESIYRDELGIRFTENTARAYSDLISEGVIDHLPSRKLHFFHQTLLEYAIAYWLTRHSAQTQREQLFASLNQPDGTFKKAYWLPVLRQLLTIVETETEFEQIVQQLNQSDLGISGAIAMAATSRDQPDALRQLLANALEQGEAYQKRLRQAYDLASQTLVEQTWDELLLLLETGSHATAGNTAQLTGALIVRWWQTLKQRLPEALGAISRRIPSPQTTESSLSDDRALFAGWLLHPCLKQLQASSDPVVLSAIQPHIPLLGYRTCASVIQLHLSADIPVELRDTLLRQLIANPVPNHESVERAFYDLVTQMVLEPLPECFSLGNSWIEILDSNHLAGWDVIQAKVIGRWAASDRVILSEVLAQLLSYPPSQLRRRLIALTESIAAGAASAIVESLLLLANREIAPEHLRCLNTLLVQCLPSLTPTEQERLAQWLAPIAATQLEWIHPIVDLLSDVAPTARNLLEQHLKDLPEAKQNQLRQQRLRFQPIEQHPPLHQLNKVTQRSLLNLYRQQAATQAIARDRVLAIAQYRMKDIALAASQDLAQVCGVELTAAQLLPLLQSIFPGVRVNGLSAIIDRATESHWLSSRQVSEISQQLAQEPNQTVVRRFCDLIAVWVRHHQIVPADVIATLAAIPARLAASQQLEGGTGRSLLNAFKAIAQSTDETVNVQALGVAVCQLLNSIRSIQIRNSESEMIDLLCAMHRLDETFVRQVTQTECPQLAQKDWHPNVAIVIKTIARIESQYSPLLDWLLSVDWCTPEMRSVILEVRGG